MSTVQLALSVGDHFPISAARTVAAAAEQVGVAAIRLVDADDTVDPSVAAAYLAGVHGGVGYVPEIPTTHHAPYNTARRVLSLDRATGGRAGVALLPGGGDEVSDTTTPDPDATDPAQRWTEYAHVLTRLWESFPRDALIGDQAGGIVADDTRITPIEHRGSFYRVAGPLDGPSSVQGRPVIVADLGTVLDAASVAASADVVVTDPGGAAAVVEALGRVGRARGDVAVLGRVRLDPDDPPAASVLLAWASQHGLDGFELVPTGDADAVAAALRVLVPRLVGPGDPPATLRAAYGLAGTVAVPA